MPTHIKSSHDETYWDGLNKEFVYILWIQILVRPSLIGSAYKEKCWISYSMNIEDIVCRHLSYCKYCTLTQWTLRVL